MTKPHSCFVIMPFCDTEHGLTSSRKKITKSQWAHIFEHWIKKAVESYKPGELACKRSAAKPGSFIKGIVGDLASADIVVADLTGARPNVYYELGIRHGLKIGTIIVTQDRDALPSDLSNYFVFDYEYSEKAHEYDEYFRRFEKRMHETIKAWEDAEDPCDNPVSDFLGIKDQIVEKEMEIAKDELRRLLQQLKKQLIHNLSVCKELLRAAEGAQAPKFADLLIVDVFPLETIYTRLISYDWRILSGVVLEPLEDFVIYHRRLFSEVAATCASLNANPEQPHLCEYFFKLLNASVKDSNHLESYLDQVIKSIDTIKLVKKGSEKETENKNAKKSS